MVASIIALDGCLSTPTGSVSGTGKIYVRNDLDSDFTFINVFGIPVTITSGSTVIMRTNPNYLFNFTNGKINMMVVFDGLAANTIELSTLPICTTKNLCNQPLTYTDSTNEPVFKVSVDVGELGLSDFIISKVVPGPSLSAVPISKIANVISFITNIKEFMVINTASSKLERRLGFIEGGFYNLTDIAYCYDSQTQFTKFSSKEYAATKSITFSKVISHQPLTISATEELLVFNTISEYSLDYEMLTIAGPKTRKVSATPPKSAATSKKSTLSKSKATQPIEVSSAVDGINTAIPDRANEFFPSSNATAAQWASSNFALSIYAVIFIIIVCLYIYTRIKKEKNNDNSNLVVRPVVVMRVDPITRKPIENDPNRILKTAQEIETEREEAAKMRNIQDAYNNSVLRTSLGDEYSSGEIMESKFEVFSDNPVGRRLQINK
eukprot:NODE_497_length_7708_cov_0.291760.p1 type:complete len:437 gc:universal NODE_497_length_7708_cov_0.291760:909-2219(+)